MMDGRIEAFAKANGFDGAEYLKKWNGFKVYEPFSGDDLSFTGLPLVILVKGDLIRMSTPEESMMI